LTNGEFPSEWDGPANHRLVKYLIRHRGELSFTKCFWKGCEPNAYELERFSQFAVVMRRRFEGASAKTISSEALVSEWSVYNWTHLKQKPKLAHYLEVFLRKGKPRNGFAWLVLTTPLTTQCRWDQSSKFHSESQTGTMFGSFLTRSGRWIRPAMGVRTNMSLDSFWEF
jgi:hypothetical protein